MTTTAVTLAAESLGSFPVAVPWPSEMVDDIPVISLSVGLEGESLYRMRTVEGGGRSGVNERAPAPTPAVPRVRHIPAAAWTCDPGSGPSGDRTPCGLRVGDRRTKGARGDGSVMACRRRSSFRDLLDMKEELPELRGSCGALVRPHTAALAFPCPACFPAHLKELTNALRENSAGSETLAWSCPRRAAFPGPS